jgi:hypothetical protein
VNGTKVSSVDASGQAVDQKYATGGFQAKFPVPPIITPATSFPTPPATPGTGSQVAERYNRVVTGAPTATFVQLPIGTPNVGKTYTVDNESANPAAIVPVSEMRLTRLRRQRLMRARLERCATVSQRLMRSGLAQRDKGERWQTQQPR